MVRDQADDKVGVLAVSLQSGGCGATQWKKGEVVLLFAHEGEAERDQWGCRRLLLWSWGEKNDDEVGWGEESGRARAGQRLLVAGASACVGTAAEGEARARAAWWVWVCMAMRGGTVDVAAIEEAGEVLRANVGVLIEVKLRTKSVCFEMKI